MTINHKERLFKALTNANRRSILRQLRDHDPQTVKQLCSITGCTFSVTAMHAKQLSAADLLARDNSEWAASYSLNPNMRPWVRQLLDRL